MPCDQNQLHNRYEALGVKLWGPLFKITSNFKTATAELQIKHWAPVWAQGRAGVPPVILLSVKWGNSYCLHTCRPEDRRLHRKEHFQPQNSLVLCGTPWDTDMLKLPPHESWRPRGKIAKAWALYPGLSGTISCRVTLHDSWGVQVPRALSPVWWL